MNDITFNGIRESLIQYYSSQDEFKDFNWTAPAITTLIDAQAYLGYYLFTYANFALNESFLDTAQKRSSVVSKARNIGYYPAQYKASVAKVKLDYIGSIAIDDYTIPAGTTFSATNNGTTYYFRTYEPALVQKTSTGRYWCQLSVREGTEITNRWVQNKEGTTQFILSNPKVDTSTIKVTVYNNSSDKIGIKYSELKTIGQFGPDEGIYTIEENAEGNVQLYFGDGILAKKIHPGNIVECTYLATSGSEANGIASFQLVSIPETGYDNQLWTVSTVEISNSGTDRESVDSIRLNAPRFFQRQGRNVIAEDYKSDVMKHYGELIDAISVWGGENNTPPEYGSVFLSIKPKNSLSLSTVKKQEIINTILQSSVVGITPKIIDPNIIFVDIKIDTTYNKLYLKMTPQLLKDTIIKTTETFFKNTVSSFNIEFKYSKLLATLFAIDENITDIESDIKIYQYFSPVTNDKMTYILDFKNKIEPSSIFIGPYTILGASPSTYYIDDDGAGNLRARSDNTIENVGTIDYETGILTIKKYAFSVIQGQQIQAMVSPANKNMSVSHNYIFSINTIDVGLNGK